MDTNWDCIVVGGGAAGLSAALVLGRARRRTLVVDAGRPSNATAHGIGGLLGSDGRSPADFYAGAREELAAYPAVELRAGEVARGETLEAGGFALDLADGTQHTASHVLLATGMEYRYADHLPGLAERWGRSVFHCPFCHGWEHRDQPLGVLDRGASGVHRALLLSLWSDDVTLLADGPADLEPEEAAQLQAAGIDVDERSLAGFDGPDAHRLTAATFASRERRPLEGLLLPVTLHQRSRLADQLGAAVVEVPLSPDAVEVDPRYATGVPGLFAAGDVTGQMPSVANAVAAGSNAAAMVVQSLMSERFGLVPA